MTTIEDISDPWKKQSKTALDKATDDKLATMERHEKIALRRELEICLEREKHGVPHSVAAQMSEDNPFLCIVKGAAMMKESSKDAAKKQEARQQIEFALSKLPEYNKYEMGDPIHANNLQKARLEMELNATGKEAIGADYVELSDIVQKERRIRKEIKANDANTNQLRQQQRRENQKLWKRLNISGQSHNLQSDEIFNNLSQSHNSQRDGTSNNLSQSNNSQNNVQTALAGLGATVGVGVIAKKPAASLAVIGYLMKGNAISVAKPIEPTIPSIGNVTQKMDLSIMDVGQKTKSMNLGYKAPKISNVKLDPIKSSTKDVVSKAKAPQHANVKNGIIGGVLGGIGGYGGIKIAQNVLECEEHQKLNTTETAATVGVCVVGGAAAMVAAPAVITGVAIVGVSSVFGGIVQWVKKKENS